MANCSVKLPIDAISTVLPKNLRGLRMGLLVHPASVNKRLQHSTEAALNSRWMNITALIGPQHGIRGETQDNMVEWEGFKDSKTGLPVFSLYGRQRKPTREMLEYFDCIVIDLQDIGARYYTFIWTMDLVMEACSEAGMPVVVLDRPNPINGIDTEGPVLDESFSSFVGLRPITVRHGMTIGEIANYLQDKFHPSLELYVIKIKGWSRSLWFDETSLPWVMPSPNMPTLDTATVYPGQCLLEGTTLSEGRGTTRPFEIFGAPFINPDKLLNRLKDFRLKGLILRPLYFMPTFQKHCGSLCGGAQIHITNRETFKPFKTSVAILKAIYDIYPNEKLWRDPPYEYEHEKLPIDILSGSENLRKDIEKGKRLKEMELQWSLQTEDFNKKVRSNYLLYD